MAKKPTGDQKLYRNAGVSELVIEGQEMEPGSEFKATLDPLFESQMLSGGHLEILADQSTKADEAQAAAAEGNESVSGSTASTDEDAPSRRRRSNS